MENKPKKVLIIGGDKSAPQIMAHIEKFGDNIEFVTPKEAREQGLMVGDFLNTPIMKITPRQNFKDITMSGTPKSGREKRRERRKKGRKK